MSASSYGKISFHSKVKDIGNSENPFCVLDTYLACFTCPQNESQRRYQLVIQTGAELGGPPPPNVFLEPSRPLSLFSVSPDHRGSRAVPLLAWTVCLAKAKVILDLLVCPALGKEPPGASLPCMLICECETNTLKAYGGLRCTRISLQ